LLDFNDQLIDAPCPLCGYELEIRIIDIRLESREFCPNCKATILLRDEEASTETGLREVDRAMRDLEKTFRRFGG
jgi:predicted RNA-binding Zn-ribbon protein involved in translation (DUF1610 family)